MSNFYSSSYRDDGYRDGLAGNAPSAPEGVHGQEYMEGYRDGQSVREGQDLED